MDEANAGLERLLNNATKLLPVFDKVEASASRLEGSLGKMATGAARALGNVTAGLGGVGAASTISNGGFTGGNAPVASPLNPAAANNGGKGGGGGGGGTPAGPASAGIPKPNFGGLTFAPKQVWSPAFGGAGGSGGGGGGGGRVAAAGAQPPSFGAGSAARSFLLDPQKRQTALDIAAAGADVGASAMNLLPDPLMGIQRREDARFSSARSGMGSDFMQRNRRIGEEVLGTRFWRHNADQEIIALASQNNMGASTQQTANLLNTAGWAARNTGADGTQVAQAWVNTQSDANAANMSLAYLGVPMTDAEGNRRSMEDIARDIYNSRIKGDSGLQGEDAMKNLELAFQSNHFGLDIYGESKGAIEQALKEQLYADQKGVEWSMSEDSEYAEVAGLNDTSTSDAQRKMQAETSYADTGADAAAEGFDAVTAASAKLTQAFEGMYKALGPVSHIMQMFNGGMGAYNASGPMQGVVNLGKSVVRAALPFFSEGTLRVNRTQVAQVHEGEMIIPSRIADAVRGTLRSPSGLRDGSRFSREAGQERGDVGNVGINAYDDGDGEGILDRVKGTQSNPFGSGLWNAKNRMKGIPPVRVDASEEESSGGAGLSKAAQELMRAASELRAAAKSLRGGGSTPGKAAKEDGSQQSGAGGMPAGLSAGLGLMNGASAAKALGGLLGGAKDLIGGVVGGVTEKLGGLLGGGLLGDAGRGLGKMFKGLGGIAPSALKAPEVVFKELKGAMIQGANTVLPAGLRINTDDEDDGPAGDVDVSNLVHPATGAPFHEDVLRWAGTVTEVMDELGIDRKYLPGILAQINQESSGNPNAANTWDSNAQKGHASFGLLQTIAPTYQQYAREGAKGTVVKKDIGSPYGLQDFVQEMVDPKNNIYAALRYAMDEYGGMKKFDEWLSGKNDGYSQGAWRVNRDQIAQIHEGEMILPSAISTSVRQALREHAAGMSQRNTGPQNLKVEVTLLNATEAEGKRLASIIRKELPQMMAHDELTRT